MIRIGGHESVHGYAYKHACVGACACVRVRACVHACMRARACVCEFLHGWAVRCHKERCAALVRGTETQRALEEMLLVARCEDVVHTGSNIRVTMIIMQQ